MPSSTGCTLCSQERTPEDRTAIVKQEALLTWFDNWPAIYLPDDIACNNARQGAPGWQQACFGSRGVWRDCLDDGTPVDPELPSHSLRGHLR